MTETFSIGKVIESGKQLEISLPYLIKSRMLIQANAGGGKSHIVVHITHNKQNYVVDGTIKQFQPNNGKMVFLRKDYPFKKELQTGERWHK